MAAPVNQSPAEQKPPTRPQIPLRRLLLLTLLTAALAFAIQATLVAAGTPGADLLILILVPAAAAAAMFFGLRPYPAGGRARLAAMAAVGLFLVGLSL